MSWCIHIIYAWFHIEMNKYMVDSISDNQGITEVISTEQLCD